MDLRLAVIGAVALGCGSTGQGPPLTVTAEPVRSVVVPSAVSDSVRQAWTPDNPLVLDGGECSFSRSSGNGSATVRAFFPTMKASRSIVTLSFDSVGHLVRYSETRGMPRMIEISSAGLSASQRDSAVRARITATRSTYIMLDFAVDEARAFNEGGGRPSQSASGSVRSMESLDKLGPPVKTIAHVRRLCSV
jgi:hypothetical protein